MVYRKSRCSDCELILGVSKLSNCTWNKCIEWIHGSGPVNGSGPVGTKFVLCFLQQVLVAAVSKSDMARIGKGNKPISALGMGGVKEKQEAFGCVAELLMQHAEYQMYLQMILHCRPIQLTFSK